jgi:DNA-directed RNA polymerase specialized sigma24 family protein
MHVALIHRKVNDGRLQRPISFRIKWHDSGAVTVEPEEFEDVPEFVEELPLADQVAVAIRNHGPLTIDEIAEVTGQPKRSLATIVSRNRSRFRRIGDKKWDTIRN